MNIKDNFSAIANNYATWRPNYPDALFNYLASLCKEKNTALDCGTGNGQAAKWLAKYFTEVQATDISQAQIKNAIALPNIFYSISPAEKTNFPNQYFDLLCAAQAAHWFNHTLFYTEAERILKPNGVLAIIGYGLLQIDEEIDKVLLYLYKNILGNYWDAERKYIDDNYQSLPFPYKTINVPVFEIVCNWNFEQLIGYINTWSALNHYKKINDKDALFDVVPQIKKLWGDEKNQKIIRFPILAKIAIVNN